MSKSLRGILIGLIFLCIIIFPSCSRTEKVDFPPSIMFQNSIYRTGSNPNETSSFYENELIKWGTIMSSTIDNELPTVNFQATDESLIGCTICTSKSFPNYIFVLYEDEKGFRHYSPYEKVFNEVF